MIPDNHGAEANLLFSQAPDIEIENPFQTLSTAGSQATFHLLDWEIDDHSYVRSKMIQHTNVEVFLQPKGAPKWSYINLKNYNVPNLNGDRMKLLPVIAVHYCLKLF